MKRTAWFVAIATGLSGVTTAQINGPGLGTNRITQADITGGGLTNKEIRRKGLEIFTTPFNHLDGFGDGPVNPLDTVSPGGRPTTNGTWLRVNGLDTQTCLECHSVTSNATIPATLGVGGVAGIGGSAFGGVTSIDITDADASGVAEVTGRLINPPFLFGSGGVELVGKEMTTDLQIRKAQAQANPGTIVSLTTKGVSFGSISFDAGSQTFDTSAVEGIDGDLVVRPFGRKGEFSSVRAFGIGALQFHLGMQPVEAPGVGLGVDADGDGVVNEILVGELSALHIFGANLERPVEVNKKRKSVRRGKQIFQGAGCATCHVPAIRTDSRDLDLAFPEVETDPTQNIYHTVDLAQGPAGFKKKPGGGLSVPLFSDLKRHHMGPGLAENTGGALDPFFITPRLWGISDTAPYLHDGRALTLDEAISMHGGEGAAAAANFQALSGVDRIRLLAFLGSLRTPTDAAADISQPVRQ